MKGARSGGVRVMEGDNGRWVRDGEGEELNDMTEKRVFCVIYLYKS